MSGALASKSVNIGEFAARMYVCTGSSVACTTKSASAMFAACSERPSMYAEGLLVSVSAPVVMPPFRHNSKKRPACATRDYFSQSCPVRLKQGGCACWHAKLIMIYLTKLVGHYCLDFCSCVEQQAESCALSTKVRARLSEMLDPVQSGEAVSGMDIHLNTAAHGEGDFSSRHESSIEKINYNGQNNCSIHSGSPRQTKHLPEKVQTTQ